MLINIIISIYLFDLQETIRGIKLWATIKQLAQPAFEIRYCCLVILFVF